MLIPTIIMGVIAIVLLFIGYQKGGGEHILGLKLAGNMVLQIVPLLIFAFIIAGILPLIIPQETISKWIGVESGFRGILIGSAVGGLMPGGPFVCLPIAGKLRKRSKEEVMMKELMTEGIISIAKGDNPRLLEQKLNAYLPPILRESSFN